MIVTGNTKLEIIQGDTLSFNVQVGNVELDTIETLYFSCKSLGITKQLTRKDDLFELEIDCDETCNFHCRSCNYDITANFVGGKVLTLVHQAPLVIIGKTNKVIV